MIESGQSVLQVTNILKDLEIILQNKAAFCERHNSQGMIYCNVCNSFVISSHSYSRHVGRNMGRKKERYQCVWCDGINFVPANYKDLSELRELYRQQTPNIIIQGIKKACSNTKLAGHLSIYGSNFTDYFANWEKLNQENKLKQIMELFTRQDKLTETINHSNIIAQRVIDLEKALF